MEKNTSLVHLSDSVAHFDTLQSGKKDEVVPSEQTLKNILSYSKALKVEQCKDGQNSIEYIAN